MAQAKQATHRKKRASKSRTIALPVLSAAGASLALTSNASATLPAANLTPQNSGPQMTLSEEEISDVSLATFYVFDKENEPKLGQDLILARGGCGGGGGCGGRGCGGGGCAGARGCGGGGCGCAARGGGCAARGCGCAGRGCGCGRGCRCGRACGCGGVFIGGCFGCGGGCGGSCWTWWLGRWVWAC
jgi:hypothetical protein